MSPKKFFRYNNNKSWTEDIQIVAQLGLTMAGSIIFCLLIGRLIDGWLNTSGLFTSVFIILGIIGGGVVVYRQIMEITEPEKIPDEIPDETAKDTSDETKAEKIQKGGGKDENGR